MRRRFARALPVFAVGLAFAAPARAQATGFALDRFDPSERGSEWFSGESLDLRGDWRPAAGAVLDYAYRPLVLYNLDGSVKSSIVRDQFFTHLGGAVTFADRLRVGISLPVALYQFGHEGTANGVTYPAPPSDDVGDLRLGVDVRVLGRYGDPLTVAVGVQAYLPSGRRDSYTGDGTFRVQPHVLAAGEYGPLVYSARVGFDYRQFDKTFAGSELGSELTFGATAGVKVIQRTIVVGPEVFGSTVVDGTDGPFKTRNTPFELLFGGHYLLAGEWRVGAAVGPGLSQGYGSPSFRLLGSLEWAPGDHPTKFDRDEDGVDDADDACPEVPGLRTNARRTNGCPPAPPPDRDFDGVVDVLDACPETPGAKTDDPRTNGCPPDRDRDGIVDLDDACPEVPGVRTVDRRTNGCPSDKDGDHIPDDEDACPETPGSRTGDAKTNGCPADRDKDGITDDKDACPDDPGRPDRDPKKNGCPIAFVKEGQIRITEQVKFRFAKAELDPAGDSILEAVAQVLRDHPEITRVRVEGYTDTKGSAALNLRLSDARAATVTKWLAQHGVDKARLESRGFGGARPIDDNGTEEGRQNNRRVEFHIVGAPLAPRSGPGGESESGSRKRTQRMP